MTEPAYLIFVRAGSPGGAVAVAFPFSLPAAEVSASALAALRAAGYAGQAVVLGIPSGACLCAPIFSHDLPAKERRRAMLYRLEEKVPLSAEEVVADFVPTSEGSLGVCVARAALVPLVESLEGRGVPVAAVCPTLLLALQHRMSAAAAGAGRVRDGEAGGAAADPFDAVVCGRDGQTELILLDHGVPRGWSVLSDDPKELLLHLKLEALNGRGAPRRLLAIGLPRKALDVLESGSAARVTDAGPAAWEDEAAAMAEQVLAGTVRPWADFRGGLGARDMLRPVRTPLRLAAAAVALCLLSACGAMLWRSARYDRLAEQYADEQREVFRRTFPRQPEPEDVRSRLASEERGLRGLSGDPAALPPQPPGLLALRELLAAMPADVRFRILELRLEGTQFTLEGQSRTHGDADAIASALRAAPGMTVEPPRTEQLSVAADPAGSGESSADASPATAPATAPATPTADPIPTAVAFTITGTIIADVGQPGRAAR